MPRKSLSSDAPGYSWYTEYPPVPSSTWRFPGTDTRSKSSMRSRNDCALTTTITIATTIPTIASRAANPNHHSDGFTFPPATGGGDGAKVPGCMGPRLPGPDAER